MAEPLLLESGQVANGRWLFWRYHRERIYRSVREVWADLGPREVEGLCREIEELVALHYWREVPGGREVKRGRIRYSPSRIEVELEPLRPRSFRRFGVVDGGEIEYRLKWADRTPLNRLRERVTGVDEVIILKGGLVTDTTISNLAFWDPDRRRWVTPSTPLLPGTTRARLLERGVIEERPITGEELPRFRGVGLLNGVLGFYWVRDPVLVWG